MAENGSTTSMKRVADAAAALGLHIEIRRLDESTRTAQDAADACGCAIGQIVKSLVFEDTASGQPVLLLVSGGHQLDADHVRKRHDLDLKRCDPRRVRAHTGFAIGGVAPIGHVTPTRIFIDRALLGYHIVWAAAGRPDSVFSVDPMRLRETTGAETIDVTP